MPRRVPALSRATAPPLGRATAPRPPHAVGLGAPGERKGATVELGERGVARFPRNEEIPGDGGVHIIFRGISLPGFLLCLPPFGGFHLYGKRFFSRGWNIIIRSREFLCIWLCSVRSLIIQGAERMLLQVTWYSFLYLVACLLAVRMPSE